MTCVSIYIITLSTNIFHRHQDYIDLKNQFLKEINKNGTININALNRIMPQIYDQNVNVDNTNMLSMPLVPSPEGKFTNKLFDEYEVAVDDDVNNIMDCLDTDSIIDNNIIKSKTIINTDCGNNNINTTITNKNNNNEKDNNNTDCNNTVNNNNTKNNNNDNTEYNNKVNNNNTKNNNCDFNNTNTEYNKTNTEYSNESDNNKTKNYNNNNNNNDCINTVIDNDNSHNNTSVHDKNNNNAIPNIIDTVDERIVNNNDDEVVANIENGNSFDNDQYAVAMETADEVVTYLENHNAAEINDNFPLIGNADTDDETVEFRYDLYDLKLKSTPETTKVLLNNKNISKDDLTPLKNNKKKTTDLNIRLDRTIRILKSIIILLLYQQLHIRQTSTINMGYVLLNVIL